ncbi:hypothetical protein [Micromonospora sp. KC207]|nr:hypothetical protein [Micromonospora sp. KC207]
MSLPTGKGANPAAKVGGYNVWLHGCNPLLATLPTLLAAPDAL